MKLSIVSLVYDILLVQSFVSVATTLLLTSVYFEKSGHLSIINTGIFAFIEWVTVCLLLVTMDMLFLPPIFMILHLTCGLAYYA